MRSKRIPLIPLLLLGVALLGAAQAQQAPKKKLYSWIDANGVRQYGDSLPSNAVNQAHDEFSASSGAHTASVQRAPSIDELAAAAAAAKQQQEDAAAEAARKRTEQAMLSSYDSEADLRRVFDEQRAMIDNDTRTARFNIDSQRAGLELALRSAGEKELSGGKVDAKAVADIRRRHAALLQEQALETGYEQKRKDLDAQVEDALVRYREMKGITGPNAPAAAATATSTAQLQAPLTKQ